ncbi:hypothetical protein C8J57DRAFT_1223144 [Mycena rebaudengoi]|nr:hypothetical protein C8J57DRAFT_1223144 [Mycena rebaudengoi]
MIVLWAEDAICNVELARARESQADNLLSGTACVFSASGNGTSPGACGLRGCSGAAAVCASRAAPAHDSRHIPRIPTAVAPPRTAPAPAGAGAADADSDRGRTVGTRGWWWWSMAAPRTAAAQSHPHTRRAVVVTLRDEERLPLREDGPGVDVPLHADNRLLQRHAVYGQRALLLGLDSARASPRPPHRISAAAHSPSANPPSPHTRSRFSWRINCARRRRVFVCGYKWAPTVRSAFSPDQHQHQHRQHRQAHKDRKKPHGGIEGRREHIKATPTPTPRARRSDSAAPRLRQHAHPLRRMTVPEPRVGAPPAPTLPTAQILPRTNETPPQFAQNEDHALQTEKQKKRKEKKATDEREADDATDADTMSTGIEDNVASPQRNTTGTTTPAGKGGTAHAPARAPPRRGPTARRRIGKTTTGTPKTTPRTAIDIAARRRKRTTSRPQSPSAPPSPTPPPKSPQRKKNPRAASRIPRRKRKKKHTLTLTRPRPRTAIARSASALRAECTKLRCLPTETLTCGRWRAREEGGGRRKGNTGSEGRGRTGSEVRGKGRRMRWRVVRGARGDVLARRVEAVAQGQYTEDLPRTRSPRKTDDGRVEPTGPLHAVEDPGGGISRTRLRIVSVEEDDGEPRRFDMILGT